MLSFFSHAHVRLEYARKELIGAVEPNESEKIIKDWIPNNEDARIIYRVSQSSRDKAIFLTLYQSGLSPVDVCALSIQHFNFYDDNGNWIADKHQYLCKLREKTNIRQQTFLSIECIDELKIYLQSRGFPTRGALFLSVHNKRLKPRDINDIVKGIVSNAFPKRTEWKTKNLRDSFMNALVKAKIPSEIKNIFVGHIRPNAQKDYDYTEDTLRPLYEDTFKFLSINGVGSHNRKLEELEKNLKTTMSQNQEAFNKTIAILTERIGKEENERKNLEETSQRLQEKLEDITDLVSQRVEFFSVYSEKEKEAMRKRFGLKEYSEEEKEVYRAFRDISMEIQKERGTRYLTAEDDKEMRRRFQAWLIEREQSKEK